jgi:hypothetical protein
MKVKTMVNDQDPGQGSDGRVGALWIEAQAPCAASRVRTRARGRGGHWVLGCIAAPPCSLLLLLILLPPVPSPQWTCAPAQSGSPHLSAILSLRPTRIAHWHISHHVQPLCGLPRPRQLHSCTATIPPLEPTSTARFLHPCRKTHNPRLLCCSALARSSIAGSRYWPFSLHFCSCCRLPELTPSSTTIASRKRASPSSVFVCGPIISPHTHATAHSASFRHLQQSNHQASGDYQSETAIDACSCSPPIQLTTIRSRAAVAERGHQAVIARRQPCSRAGTEPLLRQDGRLPTRM